MDLLWPLAFILWIMIGATLQERHNEIWDYLSLRYGLWYEPPRTVTAAIREGYVRVNSVCRGNKFYGFLFRRPGDMISMPIYDSNYKIVGIQSAFPGNMRGFNFMNQSIPLPPREVAPPILPGERTMKGVQMYTLTAYFKHPKLICSPQVRQVRHSKGLYVQTGFDTEREYIQIPIESRHLKSDWKPGSCVPKMGLHYFHNLSPDMPCENIYPLFLMYNTEGKLGGFGWSFQGIPATTSNSELSWFKLSPEYYPFTFDTTKLPKCMFNPDFRVSGIHFWLHKPDTMLCTVASLSVTDTKTTTITQRRSNAISRYENKFTESNAEQTIATMWLTLCLLVRYCLS